MRGADGDPGVQPGRTGETPVPPPIGRKTPRRLNVLDSMANDQRRATKGRELKTESRRRFLHHRRHGDAEHGERADQFAAHDRDGCEQKLLPAFIGFVQDGVTVVEVIEQLR